MPLVKVNELLHHATENGYGVAAVNVFNYETIKWVAEAANRERIPVIIQFYPGFDKYIALKHVAAIAKDFAEKSSVPPGYTAWVRPSWYSSHTSSTRRLSRQSSSAPRFRRC